MSIDAVLEGDKKRAGPRHEIACAWARRSTVPPQVATESLGGLLGRHLVEINSLYNRGLGGW